MNMNLVSKSVLALALASVPLAAQMTETIRVTLPRAVRAGEVMLPAGDYRIVEDDDNSGAPMLRLAGADGRSVAVLASVVQEPQQRQAAQAHVSLRCTGGDCALHSVWPQGRDYGFVLLSARP